MIVDESAESREVLRALLERRGAATFEAQRPNEAARLAKLHHPDLIVYDAECDWSPGGQQFAELRAAAQLSDTPIVILGTLSPACGGIPTGEFIAKPYHYGPLIRKIEELLGAA
jgi:DNA-binding response OmpR family regulator